jgi:anthranilate synthase component 2
MILIIDNYDSFTYNIVHLVGRYKKNIKVVRNDKISVDEIKELKPSHIILSPGPGYPRDAGICKEVINYFIDKLPILGICLGHQAICEVYGAEIIQADKLMHGKQSEIHIANGNKVFYGLPPIIKAGRYHSLIADRGTISDELLIIAEDEDGNIMGVKHRDHEAYGLQFHPESILTPQGALIISNFVKIGGEDL